MGGIQKIDDGSLSHMIKSIAPVQNRNYVVMQLRTNLIKDERSTLVKKFSGGLFKKVAHVQVGEPTLEFKKKVQEATLRIKQDASDKEFRAKVEEEKRKREHERQ